MDLCADSMLGQLETEDKGINGAFGSSGPPPLAHSRDNAAANWDLEKVEKAQPRPRLVEAPVAPPGPAPTYIYLLWMLTACTTMTPWMSMITFGGIFKKKLQSPSALLWLNAGYLVPALPILVIAIFLVPRIDRLCGFRWVTAIRFTICQLIISALVCFLPKILEQCPTGDVTCERWGVIGVSVGIGIFGALGYGTLFNFLIAFFPRCGPFYGVGLFIPGWIFFGLHKAIDFSPRDGPPAPWKGELHWYVGGIIGACAVISFFVLFFLPEGRRACQFRQYLLDEAARASTVAPYSGKEMTATKESAPAPSKDAPADIFTVTQIVSHALVGLVLSILSIVTVTSFFTRVPSCDADMALNLVYIKNSCDFIGRLLTLIPSVPPFFKQPWRLLSFAALRFTATPLFFLYIARLLGDWRSDVFVYVLVGVSAVVSGVLIQCSFGVAGMSVGPADKPTAIGLLNSLVQVTLILSMVVNFGIDAALPPLPELETSCGDVLVTVTTLPIVA